MTMTDSEAVLFTLLLFFWISTFEAYSETYKRPSSPWFQREDGITCTLWNNQSGCGLGECCVKEVITFKDLDRNIIANTRCRPLLGVGELCLRQAEGYLCDCGKGLHCSYQRNETYGHCVNDKG